MKTEICSVYMPIGSKFVKAGEKYVVYKIVGGQSHGLPFDDRMEFNFTFRVADPHNCLAVIDQLREVYPFESLGHESNVYQISKMLDELERIAETLLIAGTEK